MKTRRRRQKGSGPGCSKCAKLSLLSQKTPDELYEDWKIKNKTIVDEYQKMSLADIRDELFNIITNKKKYGEDKDNHKTLLNEIKSQKMEENRKIMEDRSKETEQKGTPIPKSAIPQISIEDWLENDNIPLREKVANQKIADYNKRNSSRSDKTIRNTFGTKKGGNSKKTHKRKSRRQSK